jgi:glycosyltransferase involved in cell wall biosynthesis
MEILESIHSPMHSIILTVHNKDFLLETVLSSIKKYTFGNYELIVILDGCNDNSEKITISFSKEFDKKIKILYADNIFETKANNLGLKQAEGNRVIIVQDDMVINEQDWNMRMEKPFIFSDVFAVTARTAHDWRYNPNSKHIHLKEALNDCWCDILVHTNHADKSSIDRSIFAIRSSVNRGPLMIDHNLLAKLNYLDENYSPQELDDHDLCYRAFEQYGKVAGCYWIDYITDYSWGGTRKTGSIGSWLYEANHKNMRMMYNRHRELILKENHNENRRLL